jgi:hypothetical protein
VGDDGRLVIGMDPHKRSVTIEVMTSDEQVLGGGRFATDVEGFTSMLAYLVAWVWAIEGCEGIGRHVAQRLLAEAPPWYLRPWRKSPGLLHARGDVRDELNGLRSVVVSFVAAFAVVSFLPAVHFTLR